MNDDSVVIVGASVAGVHTAKALRGVGFEGRITLLSNEAVLPYDKPPLSKGFLAGETDFAKLALLTEPEARDLGIDVRLKCQARQLYPSEHLVELANGERIGYGRVVIATGASARWPAEWPISSRIHVLRSFRDANRLRGALRPGSSLVVIGAGFIGAEVAATARSMGIGVTLVDPAPAPMSRIVGSQLGELFIGLHQRHGVQTRLGIGVLDLHDGDDHIRVHLSDGSTVDADACVVGIGSVANDAWLASSGLTVGDGVLCDEYGRAVGVADVFAVGDVARWYDPRVERAIRHEHWTNAYEQAQVLARNIFRGSDMAAHTPIAYVWSDQYDWKIRVAGHVEVGGATAVEIIGDAETERYALLSSQDGTLLTGIVVINWPRALVAGRKALTQSVAYEDMRLVLTDLLRAQSAHAG